MRWYPSLLLICGHSCCYVVVSCQRILPHLLRFIEDFSFSRQRHCENQSAKTLSRFARPPLSPTRKDISSPSTIEPHSCPHVDGPQNWGTKKVRPTKEPLGGHLRLKPRTRKIVKMSLSHGENDGQKRYVRLSIKPEMIRPTRAPGRIICCRPGRK